MESGSVVISMRQILDEELLCVVLRCYGSFMKIYKTENIYYVPRLFSVFSLQFNFFLTSSLFSADKKNCIF